MEHVLTKTIVAILLVDFQTEEDERCGAGNETNAG